MLLAVAGAALVMRAGERLLGHEPDRPGPSPEEVPDEVEQAVRALQDEHRQD